MKFTNEDKVKIGLALTELQHSKAKEIPNESKIEFIREFENLGWDINKIIERIKKAKYLNTFGDIKFSDFVDQKNDELIPQDTIYKKAIELIRYNQRKFNELCKAMYGDRMITRVERDKIELLLRKSELTEQDLFQSKKNTKLLEIENSKVEEMRKNLNNNKEKLRLDLENILKETIEKSDIPSSYMQNCLNIAIEKGIGKLNQYFFL